MTKGYAYGTAAAFLKHVRRGDADALAMYLRHLAGCARLVTANAVRFHRPLGLGYAMAFVSGSIASLGHKMDPRTGLYAGRWPS